MKRILSTILFILVSITILGQNKVTFSYDESGNRTSKTILLNKSVVKEQVVHSEKIENREIKIYPNPTKGDLIVEISKPESLKNGLISVFDLRGKLIKKVKIASSKNNVDLSSAANGIYVLQIHIDNNVSNWKIIKE